MFEVTGVTDEAGDFHCIREATSYGVESYFNVLEGLSKLGVKVSRKYQVFVLVPGHLAGYIGQSVGDDHVAEVEGRRQFRRVNELGLGRRSDGYGVGFD